MITSKTLDELADIRIAFVFRDKAPVQEDGGNVFVFLIRDLTTGWPFDADKLVRTYVDERKLTQAAQGGDILLPGRGQTFPARLYDGRLGPVLPDGQIYVVRPKNEMTLSSSYLTWYLNRPSTQRAIADSLTGTTIPTLNKSVLKQFIIDVPSISVQSDISSLCHLFERRTAVRKALMSLESEELESACSELITRATHG